MKKNLNFSEYVLAVKVVLVLPNEFHRDVCFDFTVWLESFRCCATFVRTYKPWLWNVLAIWKKLRQLSFFVKYVVYEQIVVGGKWGVGGVVCVCGGGVKKIFP